MVNERGLRTSPVTATAADCAGPSACATPEHPTTKPVDTLTTRSACRRDFMTVLRLPFLRRGSDGEHRKAHPVVAAGLVHQVRDVLLHRGHAEVQTVPDLLIAVALADQVQDLVFAWCQIHCRRGTPGRRCSDQCAVD